MSDAVPGSFTTFGEFLKYLRRRERLTQQELGIAVGYSDTQIARLEGGQRLPDVAAVQALMVPALHLEGEPILAAQLISLARKARDKPPDEADAQPPLPQLLPESTPPHEPHISVPPLTNLPAQLTRFIGHERDIAEVNRLVSASRL